MQINRYILLIGLIFSITILTYSIEGLHDRSFDNIAAETPDIYINEVMASNAAIIADEDGDYEDWIELYNGGEEPVDLTGFGLSDDYDNPFRWVFPVVTIEPGEFLLIWASGKDRNCPEAPLHTNFRINYQGEEVLITLPDSTRIDELAPTKIPTDISYGRKPDGTGEWYFFTEPTPGQANYTEGYSKILEPPAFSKKGGFYANELELEISHPSPEATIVYTLDGSEPCIDNPEGKTYYYKNKYPENPGDPFGDFITGLYISHVYTEPITITDRSNMTDSITHISTTWNSEPYYFPGEPVNKATIVRARAFENGKIPSEIRTQPYLVNSYRSPEYSLPVVFISLNEDYLFDYYDGIYVAGEDFDNWRNDNEEETVDGSTPANYRRRGIEFEYPANLQLFEPTHVKASLDQNIGLRIHGGWSRSYPLKSLRLYARNIYSDSEFNYRFFKDLPYDSFKRLIFRNSGNDYYHTFFRDAFIQSMVGHMNFDTQAYQPVIVFINGEYWGIHNIRERYDKHYLNRVYGVDPDNIDLLTSIYIAKEGDNKHYRATLNYIEEFGLKDDKHYQYVLTRIDEENFMDYQIANIFAANRDWPGNNIDYWRLRTNEYTPESDYGHDGRWRWLIFDTDFGFGLVGGDNAYEHNTLSFATKEGGTEWPNPDWSTFLLRSFLENEHFRTKFINRYADQLNTGFLPERSLYLINKLKQQITPEIEEHISRWSQPANINAWQKEIDVMRDFAKKRPYYQRKHIKDHFDLEGVIYVNLDVSNQLKGHIRINSIEIEPNTPGVEKLPYPWQGIYFKNIPVEIEAIAAPGYRFTHWEGTVNSTSKVVTLDKNEDIYLTAHFEKNNKPVLIHYWLFDTQIPNDTPLEYLDAFYSVVNGATIEYESCLEGYPFYENHPKWRKASMERRNKPTPINYRPEGNNNIEYNDVDMRALQVRQPFTDNNRENTMIFHLPTTGFSNIIFRFAAKDEDAADMLVIDYNIQKDNNQWISSGLTENKLKLYEEFNYYEIDFTNIEGVENNQDFKIRIRFLGEKLHEDDGNRVTFNNFSLDGTAVGTHTIYASAGINGNIYPSGRIPVYHGSNISFNIIPDHNHQISDVYVDDKTMTHNLIPQSDESAIYKFYNVSANHNIYASFLIHSDIIKEQKGGVIIYPNPADNNVTISSLTNINRIDVTNLAGQVMSSLESVNSKVCRMNTGHLINGYYIVIIYTEIGTVSKKLLINRQ